MLELTLKESNKSFLLDHKLVKSVTQSDEGIFVWIDLDREKPIGYLVKERFRDVARKLEEADG